MGHVVIRRKRNVVGDEPQYVILFRCIQNMNPVHPYNTCYTGGEPVLLFMFSYVHPFYNSCYGRSPSVLFSQALKHVCQWLGMCDSCLWQEKKDNASSRCEAYICILQVLSSWRSGTSWSC